MDKKTNLLALSPKLLLSALLLAGSTQGMRFGVTTQNEASARLPAEALLEDMPSNHNSNPEQVPQLKRQNGVLTIDWAGIRGRIAATAQREGMDLDDIKTLTVSVYVNGVETEKNIPWDRTSTTYQEPRTGQMDYYVVYKRGAEAVDISRWAMRETSDGQNIMEGSFTGKYAGEAFGFHLNEALKKTGFNEELSATSVRLGNLKVVWVLRHAADAATRAFLEAANGKVDVKPEFGERGEPTRVTIRERATGKTVEANPKDFYFKVDAAFNGNAFFWDDMLVALATVPYHPWLAESTLEFWLDVQEQNDGVVPREVRKSNLISLWFGKDVTFPERAKPNLSYTNPYLMNWVADKLYRYNPSAKNLELLKRVSGSVDRYAAWMEKNRSIRDGAGRIIGFNGSALGTGLDNSRIDIGNSNEEEGHKHGFVDFLAQHISMLKDNARWNMLFARAATSEGEKAAYVAKARELSKQAVEHTRTLNQKYWNEERGFYYDIDVTKTGEVRQDLDHTVISGFWPLYANAVDRDKVNRLVEMQLNAEGFGGNFPFPANARHSISEAKKIGYIPRSYHEEDGYWDKWAHWPSMGTVAATGIERAGRPDLAHKMMGGFVGGMAQSSTKTVEESYGESKTVDPKTGETVFTARPLQHASHPHRADFAGWGKLPGLHDTIEKGVGLNPTYRRGLEWNLMTPMKIGDAQDILGPKSMQYVGGTVRELNLRRLSKDRYELHVTSENAFTLRLASRLDANDQLVADIQSRASAVEVQGGNVAQVITIDLRPVNNQQARASDEASGSQVRCEGVFGAGRG